MKSLIFFSFLVSFQVFSLQAQHTEIQKDIQDNLILLGQLSEKIDIDAIKENDLMLSESAYLKTFLAKYEVDVVQFQNTLTALTSDIKNLATEHNVFLGEPTKAVSAIFGDATPSLKLLGDGAVPGPSTCYDPFVNEIHTSLNTLADNQTADSSPSVKSYLMAWAKASTEFESCIKKHY